MAMTDPIADMLTRIRNGSMAAHAEVVMPASRIKNEIARVLKDEGYILEYSDEDASGRKHLRIKLKYHRGKPVVETIDRISKPGRRVYRKVDELPVVSGGLGIAIISTSKGVMTAKHAKSSGIGGEVICTVS